MISIIVPAFNEEPALLKRALDSVVAQTLGDFECLIVDESTRPETLEVSRALEAADRRFRHCRPTRRLGLPGSLNWGLELATRDLVARFDADDVCEPDRLERQHAFMSAHPETGVLGTALSIIDDTGEVIGERSYPTDHAAIARRMQLTTAIAHPTVLMRRPLVRAVGGYRTDFRYAEDLELWLKLLKAGVRFANLEQPLVRYRQTTFTRAAGHWRSNLRARCINFAPTQLPQRLLGIAAVGLFCVVPASVQQALYRRVVISGSA